MEGDARQGRYNTVIHSKDREIIRTVIECCDEDAGSKCLLLPIQKATARAAKYTGVSEASVMRNQKYSKEHPHDPQRTPGKHR
jgi:hypothetical protein